MYTSVAETRSSPEICNKLLEESSYGGNMVTVKNAFTVSLELGKCGFVRIPAI